MRLEALKDHNLISCLVLLSKAFPDNSLPNREMTGYPSSQPESRRCFLSALIEAVSHVARRCKRTNTPRRAHTADEQVSTG